MAYVGKSKSVTKSQLAKMLSSVPPADEAALDELLIGAQVVSLEQGQFVFHAGDSCRAFLILLDGNVRVQLISSGGREVTLYRIGPGGSCILTTSCLLAGENYPAEAIAETNIQAMAIPTASFQSALDGSTWFRQLVFDGFSSRLSSVIQKIEELAFMSIDSRLAAALLELDRKGVNDVTHQDIAVELGTAREVVSRHLKRFEADGMVQLGRGQISITDKHRIRALAAPSFGD